jgi:hypothetical protein
MVEQWSTKPGVSWDKHSQMVQHNAASISEDCNLSTGHTDELECSALLMNNPLGSSHASLHDTNPQTQLLSALGTLQNEHILLIFML